MGDCSKYSNSYDRCPDVTTTNCVKYTGPDIPCLDVCSGQSLSYLENQIATKLCELVGDVDMSTITIPECLVTAWGTKDKDILTLIQFLLDQSCQLKADIDATNDRIDTFNPLVTVDWQCCADDPCVQVGTVTLTVAIQNILNCICSLKSYVGDSELQRGYTLSSLVLYQGSLISTLQGNIASLQAQQSALLTNINTMKSTLNSWSQVIGALPSTVTLPTL